jgi:hypothetical protein
MGLLLHGEMSMSCSMRKLLVNVPFLVSLLAIVGVSYYVLPAFSGIREADSGSWWILFFLNLSLFAAFALAALFVPRTYHRPLTMSLLITLICMYELAWTGSFPMNEATFARILPGRMDQAIEMWIDASLAALQWSLIGSAVYWISFGVIRYGVNRSRIVSGNGE